MNKKIPATAKTTEDLRAILDAISFAKSCINFDWNWEIEVLTDTTWDSKCEHGHIKGWLVNTTFRRPDINTGEIGIGKGRQIYIGKGASKSGIFFSCVVCVKLIVEHEWMEAIRFDGKRVLNPHHTLEELSLPDMAKAAKLSPEAVQYWLESQAL